MFLHLYEADGGQHGIDCPDQPQDPRHSAAVLRAGGGRHGGGCPPGAGRHQNFGLLQAAVAERIVVENGEDVAVDCAT